MARPTTSEACNIPKDIIEPPDSIGERPSKWGDFSSAYWPPGWGFSRLSTATQEDLLSLPEGELEKMQAGLREVLGEEGIVELSQWMFVEEQKRNALKRGPKVESDYKPQGESVDLAMEELVQTPNWLRQWKERHEGQVWGFVAMRSTCYDDEERWKAFKERFESIIQIPFQQAKGKTGAAEAMEKFNIRWIEDPTLNGAGTKVLQEKYISLKPTLPSGQSQVAFLSASAEAIESVLSENSSHPTEDTKYWRPDAPYILAISEFADPGLEEGHEEREWFQEVFKVAAEVIVEEFWWLLDSDMRPLRRITMYTKGVSDDSASENPELEDMWWSMSPSPARLRKRRRRW